MVRLCIRPPYSVSCLCGEEGFAQAHFPGDPAHIPSPAGEFNPPSEGGAAQDTVRMKDDSKTNQASNWAIQSSIEEI